MVRSACALALPVSLFVLSSAGLCSAGMARAGSKGELPRDLQAALQRVVEAKRSAAPRAQVLALSDELEAIAARAGVNPWDALQQGQAAAAASAPSSAPAQVSAPPCSNVLATTTTFADATVVPIPDATSTLQTGWGTTKSHIVVAGADPVLWDIDVRMNITHTRCNDLKIYLISPVGTQITLTTDNNVFGYAGLFNGTLWDDSALVPVTDYPYVNGVPATAVVPEGALGAFLGEDPNGIWTLTMRDDTPGQTGVLDGWSIDVTTVPALPATSDHNWFINVAQPIPDASFPGLMATFNVSGIESFIVDVNILTAIQHTYPADLSIYLTSPQGTTVTITTLNGGPRDNVFNGTVWDDSAPSPATDYPYVNLVTAPFLCPDGALSAFMGEDPNGTWTLNVRDTQVGDAGTLSAWSLDIVTCVPPAAGQSFCSGDANDLSHVPCPCANFGTPGNGCANSFVPGGSNLAVSGAVNPDTIVLTASAMPATALAVYMQHDAIGNSVFHDGVLCASGNLIRLRTRSSVSGASTFPNSTDTVTVSQRGGVVPGSGARRYYATWYRNASTTFCPPATANVTNGMILDW